MSNSSANQKWRSSLVLPSATIKEALRILDGSGMRMVLVVSQGDILLGVITDGDIRRALLRRADLDTPLGEVMNCNPHTSKSSDSRNSIYEKMNRFSLVHVPIVDQNGRVVGVETNHRLTSSTPRDNWVFLMAGGFGSRLSPLTDNCPKPMLSVGGKPILQSILESFSAAGFRNFYISLHYLPELIKEYFGDGTRWGVTIRYVEEDTPLGTGGALGLLPEDCTDQPLIVMNSDVLTKLDFNALLDFHLSQNPEMTVCVREYEMQVPFGVIEGDGTFLQRIVEKPTYGFFVNAGIYVLSPDAVRLARPARHQNMPDLIAGIIGRGDRVVMFPIHEYWQDIGRPSDYAMAQQGKNIPVRR